ncbi:uncharacterized protein LOC109600357 isoform X2 [Aethina tumida]|uniref:uncharacterized protein LOC109600357 isoform X2 n=1 Tax=Aethina tumida TaxID=116153 RepID=UPI00096AEA02|nr:uncharacterized protein LOC109600357 isoform X2 [Aethina tumida]
MSFKWFSGNGTATRHATVCKSDVARKMSSTNVFQGELDRFNGVTVKSDKENDNGDLGHKLHESLNTWRKEGKRGIWFKVNLAQSDWVPVLAKHGFKFHHAKEDYVMMYNWLPTNEVCNIPHYAHTMIGVGAVVINDANQILVVSEKYFVGDKPLWKLPGGYVEPGENLVDAAIREVFEETNIKTTFETVLTFRHTHHVMYDCSDIYTVVSLKPTTYDIAKCEREILDCKWMNVDQYLEHPKVHELNRFFVQKYLEYKKNDLKIDCFHGFHMIVNKPYTIYHVMSRNDKDEKVEKEQHEEKEIGNSSTEGTK